MTESTVGSALLVLSLAGGLTVLATDAGLPVGGVLAMLGALVVAAAVLGVVAWERAPGAPDPVEVGSAREPR
jgi:hypothetical protein